MGNTYLLTPIEYIWIAWETILFLTFVFVCAALVRSRFSAGKTAVLLIAFTLLSVILTAAAYLGGQSVAFTLKMIPLTVYFPAILALHILSDSGFFKTVPVWCIGLFGMYAGYLSIRTVIFLQQNIGLRGHMIWVAECLVLVLVMAVICFIVIKYIRRPFLQCVHGSNTNWIMPLVLMLLFLSMFSYFHNSGYDFVINVLMTLTAIVAIFVVARLFWIEYKRQQLKKEHEEYETRLQIQQNEFVEITHNHEQMREYRHDMRHHLLALSQILRDSDNTYAEEYIDSLLGRMEDMETAIYCKNPMINAVLSSYISRARRIGCELDLQIAIPEDLNIDDMDLCIVLSNALENAVQACEREDENQRFLKIVINLRNSLNISIQNSCYQTVSFDKNGLPLTSSGQGHGFGMKSIANTAAQYNGMLECVCRDGVFRLNIIMFNISKKEQEPQLTGRKLSKAAPAVLLSVIGICIFLNLSPAAVEILADYPVVGSAVHVVTEKQHRTGWGADRFSVIEPEVRLQLPTGSAQGVQEQQAGTEALCQMPVKAALQIAARTDSFSAVGQNAAAAPTSDADSSGAAANVPDASLSTGAVHITDAEFSATSASGNGTNTRSVPNASDSGLFGIHVSRPRLTASAESGSSGVHASAPDFGKQENTDNTAVEVLPGLEEGVEDMNDQIDQYIETLREKYIWYANRKYMGHTALEAFYTILCNDEEQLSIRFDGTLNVGGSVNFSRCFILDKRTGKVLAISDLFRDGVDYITPISSCVLEQMTMRVESGAGKYFIPGTGFPDKYCFHHISEDQNFYINEQGKLVIAFDEYEVAPGSMGCVEFEIPTEIIASLLREPSLID